MKVQIQIREYFDGPIWLDKTIDWDDTQSRRNMMAHFRDAFENGFHVNMERVFPTTPLDC